MSATATSTQPSVPTLTHPLANVPDCDRVNNVLDQLLEGRDVAEADERYLLNHADDCSPCFDDIKKQQLFIGFLTDKVARHRAPASLPQAILTRLHAEIA